MVRDPHAPWMKVAMDTRMLGMEASTVFALRSIRIATGGRSALAEAELMVTEKVRAAAELQTRLATGAFGLMPLGVIEGATSHYREKVGVNRRSLRGR